MATIVTRSGKGSPLTNTEVDSNFTNLNTDKLELSGGTLTGNLSFGDNDKAIFGAGSDLQIYHDGSHSYINEAGTGNLYIRGENVIIEDNSGNDFINGNATTGALRLYHNNAQKLATTSTGIDVTGTVTSDGLTVDGSSQTTSLLVNTGSTAWADSNADDLIIRGADVGITISSSTTGGINFGDSTSATKQGQITYTHSGDNLDFYTATNKRLGIAGNGDISFYEDTGTAAKLTWDSSAESLNFADNVKAIFGAGSDLQIYHDGADSYVSDVGTGILRLNSNGTKILMETAGGETLAEFINNGNVVLYSNDEERLRTNGTGIDVTGTVTSDKFSITEGELEGNSGNLQLQSLSTGIIYDSANGYHTFRRNGTNAMQINGGTGDISFYNSAGSAAKFFWDAICGVFGYWY